MEANQLAGQVAVVTGGSSGLGAATAQRLAESGAHVVVLGRNADGLGNTVQAIEAAGGSASWVQGDLAEPGVLAATVTQAADDHGRLDILVNNAAVMFMDRATEADAERTAAMFQINVLSPIEGSVAAIAAMRACGAKGHVVAISSLAGRLDGGGVYGATKAALETFMAQLRLELEHDTIRATTIVPGGFTTQLGRDLTPEQRAAFGAVVGPLVAGMTPDADGRTAAFGIPDDIARAVLFAVTQPINLNVSEMVVRPAVNIDPGAFAS